MQDFGALSQVLFESPTAAWDRSLHFIIYKDPPKNQHI